MGVGTAREESARKAQAVKPFQNPNRGQARQSQKRNRIRAHVDQTLSLPIKERGKLNRPIEALRWREASGADLKNPLAGDLERNPLKGGMQTGRSTQPKVKGTE